MSADAVTPDLGLPYFGLTENGHTNCCGMKVLVPTFFSPYVAEDFDNVIGFKPGVRWPLPIYGKKVYWSQTPFRARAKREEIAACFRSGFGDLRASQMVKVFFVPTYLLTEVAEMVQAHEDKKYFRLTRQVKSGALYVFSTGAV
jgi:hypothetical protein